MAETPAGWYDDGSGSNRYWDGTAWTDHVAPSTQPAASTPKKRPVWPWIVGGGVLLLLILGVIGIIAGASFVRGMATMMGGSAGGPNQAVTAYDDAWKEADCALVQSVTTESGQDTLGLEDCDSFEAEAAEFNDAVDDYEVTITSTEIDGDQATVETIETYEDDDGEQTLYYTYYLVNDDGTWKIDDAISE